MVREEHGPRPARDALYRIMSPLAGDRPGFEEASRALFAGDREKFEAHIAPWPADLARSLRRLSARCFDDAPSEGAASDRKSTRLNSSHSCASRMPYSA